MSATQITYFTCVAINALIIAPICCFYCYKFWKLREQPLLSKRYPKLALWIVISCLIYSIFLRTIADLPRIVPAIDYGSATISIRLLFYNSCHIFYTVAYYRGFLLYYDYMRGLHLISKQWQSKITSESDNDNIYNATQDTHWTIKYKFLADRSGALYWVGLCWILLVEISIVCSTLINAENIVQPIFLLIFIAGFAILLLKVRRCRDECFFAAETKVLTVIGVIFVICNTLIVFIFDNNSQLKALLTYICTMIAVCSFVLVLTKWTVNQYNKRMSGLNLKKTNKNIRFVDILKNKDALDLFAIHLVKEFSIENLLFLCEAMQWKMELMRFDNQLSNGNIGVYLDFDQNNAGRKRNKSTVNDMNSFYYNFKYIINRYIIDNAEYCINISSLTRNEIKVASQVGDDNNINHDKLVGEDSADHKLILKCINLMDLAMNEIIALISLDSFPRFSKTIEFKQFY